MPIIFPLQLFEKINFPLVKNIEEKHKSILSKGLDPNCPCAKYVILGLIVSKKGALFNLSSLLP
ncbi:MAG: hypothetical protein ACYDBP_03545 [Leptospirales bacterium]